MNGVPDERQIDAALAQLPEWQPPPGFAVRVAALAALHGRQLHWTHLLPRGISIAAGVSVVAWLSAELMMAGLRGMAEAGADVALSWVLAAGVLVGTWRLVRRGVPVSRITS